MLIAAGIIARLGWTSVGGAAMILAAQLLPRLRRRRPVEADPVAVSDHP